MVCRWLSPLSCVFASCRVHRHRPPHRIRPGTLQWSTAPRGRPTSALERRVSCPLAHAAACHKRGWPAWAEGVATTAARPIARDMAQPCCAWACTGRCRPSGCLGARASSWRIVHQPTNPPPIGTLAHTYTYTHICHEVCALVQTNVPRHGHDSSHGHLLWLKCSSVAQRLPQDGRQRKRRRRVRQYLAL